MIIFLGDHTEGFSPSENFPATCQSSPPAMNLPGKILYGAAFSVWLLAGCAAALPLTMPETPQSGGGPLAPAAPVNAPDMPYRVDGKTYYPLANAAGYVEEGLASWYGSDFHGKKTSNGEVYNMHALTAAHKTLPFNTRVRVTHLQNGRSVVVRINDRGPFHGGRVIDLSHLAGQRLDMVDAGTARVRLQALEEAPAVPNGADRSSTSRRQAFRVQIGVFEEKTNAAGTAENLPDGQVTPFKRSGRMLYRVVTGAYNTFDRALARCDHLRARGYPRAFIIRDLKDVNGPSGPKPQSRR